MFFFKYLIFIIEQYYKYLDVFFEHYIYSVIFNFNYFELKGFNL